VSLPEQGGTQTSTQKLHARRFTKEYNQGSCDLTRTEARSAGASGRVRAKLSMLAAAACTLALSSASPAAPSCIHKLMDITCASHHTHTAPSYTYPLMNITFHRIINAAPSYTYPLMNITFHRIINAAPSYTYPLMNITFHRVINAAPSCTYPLKEHHVSSHNKYRSFMRLLLE